MRVVDVHGFGGGFTLGAVQVGFELVNKYSLEVGFGVYNTLGNRELLGYGWESVTGALDKEDTKQHPREWEPVEADMVMGNPPCSGFSTLTSSKKAKGTDAKVNDYMWQLVHFAAKVRPRIVMWESVQQTFRQGLPLLRQLHACLEEESGKEYDLYHVLHNNASVGGVSNRRRYFWVAIEQGLQFGVESCGVSRDGKAYDITRVPTFGEMLRDLEPLGMTLAEQPYRNTTCQCVTDRQDPYERHTCKHWENKQIVVADSSWWCRNEIHDGTGMVDGHSTFFSPSLRRMLDIMHQPEINELGVEWNEGERLADVLRRYYERHGDLPPSWRYKSHDTTKDKILIESNFWLGHHQQVRWRADRMAKVVTGGAVHSVVHPHLPRTLTQREVARVQGFPDDWKIWPVRNAPDLGPGWGKGVPVQAGRWGAYWARESLEGRPGSMQGAAVDTKLLEKHELPGMEREYVIDITNDYKPFAVAIGDMS